LDEPLLIGKLTVPPVRAAHVARTRLLARLDSGLQGRLILISAPAGYGKTTLLADWAQGVGETGCTVCWLSLEAADSDPMRFTAYLAETLRPVIPAAAETTIAALRSGAALPAMLPPLLVNALAAATAGGARAVLVLDDYHVLQSREVHEVVAFVIEHLPANCCVVIASREDPPLPLARLRARAQLCELRVTDLRFSQEEAAAFLTSTMGLRLAPGGIAALEQRTEGWIAGLQLAALSLQDQADVERIITAFTGSHRYVLDYLLEEVLDRQPAGIQAFLLRTSITERLCAALSDALLAVATAEATPAPESGADSQHILEQIERANLFLVPLDSERHWYRYHPLFADLLRARLKTSASQVWSQLHARAAAWYESQGLLAEAIEHALIAEDFDAAARLISRTVALLVRQPQQLRALLRWATALPEELVQSDPRLCLDYAWILAASGQIKQAEEQALRAEQHLAAQQEVAGEPVGRRAQGEDMRGELAALQTLLAARNNDAPNVVAAARKALDLLPADHAGRRAGVLIFLASAYVQSGNPTGALDAYAQAEALSVAAGDSFPAFLSIQSAAGLHMLAGRLGLAAATFRRAIAVEGLAIPALLGMPHIGLGQVLAERGQLAEAREHLLNGTQLLQALPDWNTNLVQGYATLMRIQCLQGRLDAAVETLRAIQDLPAQAGRGNGSADWLAARFWLSTGDLAAIRRWLEAASNQERASNLPALFYEPEVIMRALAYLAVGHPERALPLLREVAETSRAGGRMGRMIEIAVIGALAAQALGRSTEALGRLGVALDTATAEGYVLPFIEQGPGMQALLQEAARLEINRPYAAHLLAHFELLGQEVETMGDHPARRQSAVPEPLSERELEVLALLVAGLSGPEIAGTLTVSLNTVKTHLKSVYGKLSVHNREQAIARARELRIV
jgi:LuxR family maltose regulon positive regulatory protein